MAKNIYVLVEYQGDRVKKTSLDLIQALSEIPGTTVTAIALGTQVAVQDFGSAQAIVIEHEALAEYRGDTYAEAIFGALDKPEWIFACHTPFGRDIMPRLAALLDAGFASDSTSLDADFTLRRAMYAGKATARVSFTGSSVKLASMRPNTLMPKTPVSQTTTIKKVAPTLGTQRVTVREIVKSQSTRPDVSEAAIVISGGRSMKSVENFTLLETCADTLGAAVGASRAAVDAGFRPHRDQVGQTGKVVSPSLYIACGISGAIQHLAGMRTSKIIVAINTDPEAPIFQIADYGVVGDLFQIVPLLTEEFKKIKNQ